MRAILATDPFGGIGLNGNLPWYDLDGDMDRFVELTTGNTVVMGRSTWESLPTKPLPNRTNIVVSKQNLDLPEGVQLVHEVKDIPNAKDTWFIGGAKLLTEVWPLINEVHLTKTSDVYDCDTYIDLLYLEKIFKLEYIEGHNDHEYQIWKRKWNSTIIY